MLSNCKSDSDFLKNVALKILSQKGQKWTPNVVFPVLPNINAWNFSIFLLEVTQLESIDYFSHFEIFKFKWVKISQNKVFQVLRKIDTKNCPDFSS